MKQTQGFIVCALAVATLAWAGTASASPTPEQQCQAARYKAAGTHAKCQAKAQSKREKTVDFSVFQLRATKCRDKYRAEWAKLQARFPATSCAAARFVDNGTTVTDNLTGLQWEKKTNLDATPNGADPHDGDNTYTVCADGDSNFICDNVGSPTDGTAYTAFLSSLDSGPCFAGQCDWRLPTREELQTILSGSFPCATLPCVDALFGPTQSDLYWSSITYQTAPDNEWFVAFDQGVVGLNVKALNSYVRAVRGGF